MLKLAFMFLLAAVSAAAQPAPPAGDTPRRRDEELFAKAFVLETSTAALYEVFGSTDPASAAASYMRQGVYRREFLVLFAIARDSRTPFKTLAGERDKGVALREIARKRGADLMRLFRDSGEFQKKIEAGAALIAVSSAAAATDISTAAVPGGGLSGPDKRPVPDKK